MFKYGQKVRVTSGFYEGMEGKVIREILGNTNTYKCLLTDNFDKIESDYIPESSLELIK